MLGSRQNRAVAASVAVDPARLTAANINPATGLATDFLNHFNEAIMLLEMLPAMPECRDDLLAWRPMSYREHFAASGFTHRDLAIAAYEAADPIFRGQLDEIADQMNQILTVTRDRPRRRSLARDDPGARRDDHALAAADGGACRHGDQRRRTASRRLRRAGCDRCALYRRGRSRAPRLSSESAAPVADGRSYPSRPYLAVSAAIIRVG